MKKIYSSLFMIIGLMVASCSSSKGTTEVVKPRYHHTWAKNRYRIDIPVGARHIRMFERKRTKTVSMK